MENKTTFELIVLEYEDIKGIMNIDCFALQEIREDNEGVEFEYTNGTDTIKYMFSETFEYTNGKTTDKYTLVFDKYLLGSNIIKVINNELERKSIRRMNNKKEFLSNKINNILDFKIQEIREDINPVITIKNNF